MDKRLIIELKAAKALADERVAQILGELRSSRVEHGLMINFGAPKFEIKKYALSRIGEAGPWTKPERRFQSASRDRISGKSRIG